MVEMKLRNKSVWIFVFLLVFVAHFKSINRTSFDSKWIIPTALSIVTEFNTDLDEFIGGSRDIANDYRLEKVNGKTYNTYPLGSAIISTPVVFAVNALKGKAYVFDHAVGIECLTASLLIAFSSLIVFGISLYFLPLPASLFAVFVFAFCTSSWSSASRAMWQHATIMLMQLIVILLFLKAREKPFLVQYSGFFLSFSYLTRPTASITILLLSVYVFWAHRKWFIKYVLWATPAAIFFLAYNIMIYGRPLSDYYSQGHSFMLNNFLSAAPGLWISPGRGILFFTPIFILSIIGAACVFSKNRTTLILDAAFASVIICHWLVISFFSVWWGGVSFGPRLLSDLVPYFVYFLIRFIEETYRFSKNQKALALSSLLLLSAISFYIHFKGANICSTIDWNAALDQHPEKNWDWRDLQFLRGSIWKRNPCQETDEFQYWGLVGLILIVPYLFSEWSKRDTLISK